MEPGAWIAITGLPVKAKRNLFTTPPPAFPRSKALPVPPDHSQTPPPDAPGLDSPPTPPYPYPLLKTEGASQLLRELVAIPSVNPALAPDPAASIRTGESRVADFLLHRARKAGLDASTQPVEPGRVNLIVKLTPSQPVKHRIILAPHLDTVDAEPAHFTPVIKAGRLHGRGACDTKGSVAAMFQALANLAKGSSSNKGGSSRPAHTEIILAAMADEEVGQKGSRAFAKQGIQADLAIVGEPTRLQVVTAHKGDLWLKLETRGKAAHGSRPDLGRNAVHAMALVVDLLESQYAQALKSHRHPLLGHATISVGTIRGGRQPNIVPDLCSIHADRRTIPGETEPSVRREILALLRLHGLKATVADSKASPCPPMETPQDLPMVKSFLRAAGKRNGIGAQFFCDAAILSNAGIPSIVFGPGDIAQAHTQDEWIDLAMLERATAVFERFLQTMP